MNLEPDQPEDPVKILAEAIADVTIVARQLEAMAQNTDIFMPSACSLLGAAGAALKSTGDRLMRQVVPQMHPMVVVKDGESEQASTGIAGDPPTPAAAATAPEGSS